MKTQRRQRYLMFPEAVRPLPRRGIFIDGFAGGGGASEGIRRALGYSPHIAINHDRDAIAMHRANHPESRHYTTDIWNIDPREVCEGRSVDGAWFSPDCTDFSKACVRDRQGKAVKRGDGRRGGHDRDNEVAQFLSRNSRPGSRLRRRSTEVQTDESGLR